MKRQLMVLLAVLAVLAVAACSSSGSTASGGSTSPTGGATVSGSAGLTAAQAAATAAEQVPSHLDITTPLKSRPPAGKTFVYLQCDIDQCASEGAGIQAATAAIGWHFKDIGFQSANPATLVAGLKQALQYHPAAVGFSGLPEATWASVLPAYKAAGVPIVVFAVEPVTIDNEVIADFNGAADNEHYGQMLADWFIADSGGKGHALLVNVNAFVVLQDFSDAFRATVAKNCPGCTVTNLNETIPAATGGQLVPATVSALSKDSSINYAITSDGPFFTGLPAALAAAGLASRVKIAGQGGDVVNLTDVKIGKEAAYTGDSLTIGGWLMVDAALRHLEGMPIPADDALPTQLMVKGGTFQVSTSYNQPSNYASELESLWHVSS
jgi:ribose transport system substrate-binding protein